MAVLPEYVTLVWRESWRDKYIALRNPSFLSSRPHQKQLYVVDSLLNLTFGLLACFSWKYSHTDKCVTYLQNLKLRNNVVIFIIYRNRTLGWTNTKLLKAFEMATKCQSRWQIADCPIPSIIWFSLAGRLTLISGQLLNFCFDPYKNLIDR